MAPIEITKKVNNFFFQISRMHKSGEWKGWVFTVFPDSILRLTIIVRKSLDGSWTDDGKRLSTLSKDKSYFSLWLGSYLFQIQRRYQ